MKPSLLILWAWCLGAAPAARLPGRPSAAPATADEAWLAGENRVGPLEDITPDHWAYPHVVTLIKRGILTGYPDHRFRGSRTVDRYTLARALAKTLEVLEGGNDPRGPLTIADIRSLREVARAVPEELEGQGLRLAAVEERLDSYRDRLSRLEAQVEDLTEKTTAPPSFGYRSGELRVAGFNNEEVESFSTLILNFDYVVSDHIRGVFSPMAFVRFDGSNADAVQLWEAYASFERFGLLETARIGRQLALWGAGLTLFDRVEGFDFSSTYGDLHLEVLFTGDLMLLAETTGFTGQALGFYYVERGRDPFGLRPVHVGLYARGPIGDKLDLGVEYANYSNRLPTASNNDRYTQGFLGDLNWRPSRSLGLTLSYIWEEEDFRAISVDRDLSHHSPRSSPLEDVLQAISLATRTFPLPTTKNEINGFEDYRAGIELAVPASSYRLGLFVDRLANNGRIFDNSPNAFTLYSLKLRRPVSRTSWVEFRLRNLDFDRPDSDQMVTPLGIPRDSRSEFRVQWFGTF